MSARYTIQEGMFCCTEHERRTVLFLVPAEGMNMDVVSQVMMDHNSTHGDEGVDCPTREVAHDGTTTGH